MKLSCQQGYGRRVRPRFNTCVSTITDRNFLQRGQPPELKIAPSYPLPARQRRKRCSSGIDALTSIAMAGYLHCPAGPSISRWIVKNDEEAAAIKAAMLTARNRRATF